MKNKNKNKSVIEQIIERAGGLENFNGKDRILLQIAINKDRRKLKQRRNK